MLSAKQARELTQEGYKSLYEDTLKLAESKIMEASSKGVSCTFIKSDFDKVLNDVGQVLVDNGYYCTISTVDTLTKKLRIYWD